MKAAVLILAALIISSTGCSTITVNPEGELRRTSIPSYSDRKNFFFWGVAGEHHVNVNQVCTDQQPVQMQTQKTLSDGLLSLVTLGVYWPRHAKVWCE
ncbi:MAG: Bor family protein [Gammaproteobacteria bacterium]|nr:Bor family protein [Gammaproteobacteria bacterium]